MQPARLKEPILNADWTKAADHGTSQLVGFPSQKSYRCQCCLQQITKIPIPLTQNTKELQFLGFGLPLYFAFIRNCIFLLVLIVCSDNLISIYRATLQNNQFCLKYQVSNQAASPAHSHANQAHLKGINDTHLKLFGIRHYSQSLPLQKKPQSKQESKQNQKKSEGQNQGTKLKQGQTQKAQQGQQGQQGEQGQQNQVPLRCRSWILYISRISNEVTVDQILIRLASYFVHILMLINIRNKLMKLKSYFDQRCTSPSDYSLLIDKIPKITHLRSQIQKVMVSQLGAKLVVEVILIPQNHQFQQLEQKKNHEVQKLRAFIKDEKYNEARSIQKEIQLLQVQLKKIVVQQKLKYRQDKLHAQKAIVIFETEDEKNYVYENYLRNGFQSDTQWKNTFVEEAPQPKQIIWENIHISQGLRVFLIIKNWVLSILVLVAITVIFAFVSTKKSQFVEYQFQLYNKTHNISQVEKALLLVFGMIFFVVLFNKLGIATLFHHFTDLQRHSNNYKFQISFCLKYCLGLFFTTALMTLIVEAFISRNYYKSQYGVIEEETIMYLVNSIFVPFFWIINPLYLIKRFKQWRSKGKNYYSQQQANAIMELPAYEVGKRYGQVLQIMWFTFLYMTLIPIGGVFSVLGLGLYYWVDKYNLLRRSTLLSNVPGQLITLTLKMLEFTLVLRVVGQIIFDYQIRSGPPILSWILLFISVIYQFLPINRILQYFHHQSFKSEQKTYSMAKQQFMDSYYNRHVLFSYLKQDKQQLLREFKQGRSVKQIKKMVS